VNFISKTSFVNRCWRELSNGVINA